MLMSFICWVICLICKQFRVEERVDEWALGAEYVASLPSSPKATDTSKAMQIDSAPVDQAEGQGVADEVADGKLLGQAAATRVAWQTTALYTAPLGVLYGVTNILEYIIIQDSSGSVFMILRQTNMIVIAAMSLAVGKYFSRQSLGILALICLFMIAFLQLADKHSKNKGSFWLAIGLGFVRMMGTCGAAVYQEWIYQDLDEVAQPQPESPSNLSNPTPTPCPRWCFSPMPHYGSFLAKSWWGRS